MERDHVTDHGSVSPAATPVRQARDRDPIERALRNIGITGEALAVLMVVFGVLVIVFPHLLAWLVGLYLIVAGALQFAGHALGHRARNADQAAADAPPPPPPPPEAPAHVEVPQAGAEPRAPHAPHRQGPQIPGPGP